METKPIDSAQPLSHSRSMRLPTGYQLHRAYAVYECVSLDDFLKWAKVGHNTVGDRIDAIREEFCSDCTLAYQAAMIEEGRCWWQKVHIVT